MRYNKNDFHQNCYMSYYKHFKMRKFTYYKFAIYKFLSRFIPYFKKLMSMEANKIKTNIEKQLQEYIDKQHDKQFTIYGSEIVVNDKSYKDDSILTTTTHHTFEYRLRDNKMKNFEIRANYYPKTSIIELSLELKNYKYENGKYLSSISNFFDNLKESQKIKL